MRKLILLLLILPYTCLAQNTSMVAPECPLNNNYLPYVDNIVRCLSKTADEYDSPKRLPLRLKSEGVIGSDLKIHLHLKTNEAVEKLRINKLRTQFYNTEFCARAQVTSFNMSLGGAYLDIADGFDPKFAVANLKLPDHSCVKKINSKWGRVLTGELEVMAQVELKEVIVCFKMLKTKFTPSMKDYRRAQKCPYQVRNYLSRYYIGRNGKTLRQIKLTGITVPGDISSINFTIKNGKVTR